MINILTGIDSTASALTAERIRMDVVAQNMANADTTRGPDGQPYQRQQVVFEAVLQAQAWRTPEQAPCVGRQPGAIAGENSVRWSWTTSGSCWSLDRFWGEWPCRAGSVRTWAGSTCWASPRR